MAARLCSLQSQLQVRGCPGRWCVRLSSTGSYKPSAGYSQLSTPLLRECCGERAPHDPHDSYGRAALLRPGCMGMHGCAVAMRHAAVHGHTGLQVLLDTCRQLHDPSCSSCRGLEPWGWSVHAVMAMAPHVQGNAQMWGRSAALHTVTAATSNCAMSLATAHSSRGPAALHTTA